MGKSWVSDIKSCHEIKAQKSIKPIEPVGPRVLRIVGGCKPYEEGPRLVGYDLLQSAMLITKGNALGYSLPTISPGCWN